MREQTKLSILCARNLFPHTVSLDAKWKSILFCFTGLLGIEKSWPLCMEHAPRGDTQIVRKRQISDYIEVWYELFEVNPKDIINVISCSLGNLEYFTISTYESLKGEDFNGLNGLPHLKFVTLRCRYIKKSVLQTPEQCAVEVANKFKDCAQLLQLDIDDINIKNQSVPIAEAAVKYGRKDFDMFIGGV